MTTLEVYHCTEDKGLSTDYLFDFTPEEIKLILSRYNGTNEEAVKYGNESYEYYKIFEKYNR